MNFGAIAHDAKMYYLDTMSHGADSQSPNSKIHSSKIQRQNTNSAVPSAGRAGHPAGAGYRLSALRSVFRRLDRARVIRHLEAANDLARRPTTLRLPTAGGPARVVLAPAAGGCPPSCIVAQQKPDSSYGQRRHQFITTRLIVFFSHAIGARCRVQARPRQRGAPYNERSEALLPWHAGTQPHASSSIRTISSTYRSGLGAWVCCYSCWQPSQASLAVGVVRAGTLLQPRVVGEAAKGDTRRAPSLAQPSTRIWHTTRQRLN
jgi:hypothetical protein